MVMRRAVVRSRKPKVAVTTSHHKGAKGTLRGVFGGGKRAVYGHAKIAPRFIARGQHALHGTWGGVLGAGSVRKQTWTMPRERGSWG